MAESSSSAPRALAHPFFELRLGIAAWVALMLGTCAYCLIHQTFVSAVTPDVTRTLTLALREWGAWGLLAPWLLHMFRDTAAWRTILFRCFWISLLAASLPIAVDQLVQERSLGSSLALFWPRNFALAVVLFFVARVFSLSVVRPATSEASVTAKPPAEPTTLLVSKGTDQCLIRIDDIQHLSSAGNYVEVYARGQQYLIRATLSDLEAMLPPERFVRVHRSHIVRVSDIDRIRIERSGSGVIQLRGGGTLAISKSYRARLRMHHEAMKHRTH